MEKMNIRIITDHGSMETLIKLFNELPEDVSFHGPNDAEVAASTLNSPFSPEDLKQGLETAVLIIKSTLAAYELFKKVNELRNKGNTVVLQDPKTEAPIDEKKLHQ